MGNFRQTFLGDGTKITVPTFKIVKFQPPHLTKEQCKGYSLKYGETCILLGEREQHPGHAIVMNMNGKIVYTGIHTDNFIEVKEDEL